MEPSSRLKLHPLVLRKSTSFPCKPASQLTISHPRNLQTISKLPKEASQLPQSLIFWLEQDEIRDTGLLKNFSLQEARRLSEHGFLLRCENKLDKRVVVVRTINLRKVLKECKWPFSVIKWHIGRLDSRKIHESTIRKEIHLFSELEKDPQIKATMLEYTTSWQEDNAFFLMVYIFFFNLFIKTTQVRRLSHEDFKWAKFQF